MKTSLRKPLRFLYGLLASLALGASSQAGLIFTDTFDHGGATADFLAAGWGSVDVGGGLGTESYNGNPNQVAPESCMWGNGCTLEFYATNLVTCGDIITMDANCMRFEGYSYLREIVLWDGVDPGTRTSVALSTSGSAVGPYATWWQPPSKQPLATVTYTATAADAGKRIIFRYGHASGWGDTADVSFALTPVTAPSVTQQPKSLVRTVGETASFYVGSVGCGLTYQWTKGGLPLSGATTNPLVLSPVQLTQAGDYACAVSNTYGGFVSATVQLTVEPKVGVGPTISLGINFGDQAPWNPSVTAPAFGLHQSRWQDSPPGNSGGPINVTGFLFPLGAGAVTADWSAKNTYSLAANVPVGGNAAVTYGYLDDGAPGYSVTLTGLTNSVGFANYVVRLIAATDQANNTNFLDATITENAGYTQQTVSYPPSTSINGGTMAVSAPSAALNADSITITGPQGSGANQTRSTLAGILVTDRPILITQPQAPAGNIFSGGGFSMSADAFGVPPLTYQWQKNGTNLTGATSSTYAKASATPADSGVYNLVVNNAYGTVTSISATVSVVSYFPPIIVQQPTARVGYLGGSAGFSVVADGGQLSYVWKKGGTVIENATNATLTLTGLTALDEADYSVYISNPAGNTNSTAAHLSILPLPSATTFAGAVLADNPVAFWRLNETSGSTAFDLWGPNNAAYSGTLTLGTAGLTADGDKAVTFAPTSKAMAPFNPALNNPAGPFSVEFWTVAAATANQECLISSQNRNSSRAGFTIFHNNGGSGFSALLGNHAQGTVWLNGGTTVQGGVRYHVVVTYDGAVARIYVNGNLDGTVSIPFNSSGFEPNNVAPFQIGARNSGDGFGYSGVIDDVAVYNYALSPTQVKKHVLTVVPLTIGTAPASGIVINSAGNNGQNSGATWVASENDGATNRSGVMQFNATNANQITVPGYPSLDSTNGTICFWMRLVDFSGTGSESAMILDRRDTGGGGSGTIIAVNDGAYAATGTIFFQANPTGANPFSTWVAVNDGLWHHVAVTYGQNVGDLVSIYVDGALAGTGNNTKAWWWPTGMSVLLGKSRDTYWKKLNGSLDDVRFYSRILTESEIAQVKNAGAVVDATALVLRLNFDAAPAAGYSLSTAPVSATVQGSATVSGSYTNIGSSPCLYVPVGPSQFFRARVP